MSTLDWDELLGGSDPEEWLDAEGKPQEFGVKCV